jgi:hypothetical protein
VALRGFCCSEEGLSAYRRFTSEDAKGAEHIRALEFEIRDWTFGTGMKEKAMEGIFAKNRSVGSAPSAVKNQQFDL